MEEGNQNNHKINIEPVNLSLELYASFYPKFFYLETTLKKNLYNLIQEKIDKNWFTDQLMLLEDTLFKEEVINILRRKPKGFSLTDQGLQLESGLGFWVEFFNKRLYKATKGLPIQIFPNLPAHIKRKEIYSKLDYVREVRNDLFHYRIPTITSASKLSYLERLEKADQILTELLMWLSLPVAPEDSLFKTKDLISNLRNHFIGSI